LFVKIDQNCRKIKLAENRLGIEIIYFF